LRTVISKGMSSMEHRDKGKSKNRKVNVNAVDEEKSRN